MAGGDQLRTLREQRHESLEHIAFDANITYKTLWKIEQGKTRQPMRAILDAILEALHNCAPVHIEERRAIYAAYGYHPPFPLPEDAERVEACEHWRAEYDGTPMPAYLIDMGQQVLAWNTAAPRLVGLHPRDRRVWQFENATTIDLTFGLVERFVTIENLEAYRCSFVGTLKRELRPYEAEDWYTPCIAAAQRRYPDFKRLWAMEHPPPVSPIGCPVPLKVCLPGYSDALTFHRLKIPFAGDPRFQTVLWQPMDAATLRTWGMLLP